MPGVEIDITGPSTVTAGGTSTNFTMTPVSAFTGTYTLSDGGVGGTFTPATLSWTAEVTPKTFVYNASPHVGVVTITPLSGLGVPSFCNPATLNITVQSATGTAVTYYFPASVGGPPPFGTIARNLQIPAAAPHPESSNNENVINVPLGLQPAGNVVVVSGRM